MTAFERLDFLYMPSRDPAAEASYFVETFGGKLVFAIEAFGTRVAMVKLTDEAPALLFAGHLDGERPILVYRVADLKAASAELREAGCVAPSSSGIFRGWCAGPGFRTARSVPSTAGKRVPCDRTRGR